MPKITEIDELHNKVELTAEEIALIDKPLIPEDVVVADNPTRPAPDKVEPAAELDNEPAAEPEVKQPAESPSGEIEGGESNSAADQPEGLTPDEIELATKTYGFTENEIREWTSLDLDRAIRPFESRAMRWQPPAERQPPAAEPPRVPEKAPQAGDDDFTLDPEAIEPELAHKWNKLVAELRAEKATRAERDKEFAEMSAFVNHVRTAQAQAAQIERVRHFDSVVAGFSEPEKFGGEDPNNWTKAQYQARAKLWEETGRYIERTGAPLNGATVARAALYAFPEDISKQERAKVQEAVRAQSRKRTGKPAASKLRAPDPKGSEADNKEWLIAKYNEMLANSAS